jgi:hypothetical protein
MCSEAPITTASKLKTAVGSSSIKIDLETQGVLMWTGFISVQTQVRFCEHAEETLGSIHCGKLLHKLKDTVLHEMLCHVIQNWHSSCLFVYRRVKLKWVRLQQLLSHYTHRHTHIKKYISINARVWYVLYIQKCAKQQTKSLNENRCNC